MSPIDYQIMKVLLDTNVWISGLLWGGNSRKIIQLAQEELITLYTSLPLFQELIICNLCQNLFLSHAEAQRRGGDFARFGG